MIFAVFQVLKWPKVAYFRLTPKLCIRVWYFMLSNIPWCYNTTVATYYYWIWRINLVQRQQEVLEVQLCGKNSLVNFTRNSLNLSVRLSRKLALKSLVEYFICVVSSPENKIYISYLIRRQVKLCLMNCVMTGIGRISTHWMNAPWVKNNAWMPKFP